MTRSLRGFLAFTLTVFFSTASFAISPITDSLAPMLEKVLPAIVNIRAQIKVTDFNTLREIIKQRRDSQGDNNSGGSDQATPGTFTSVASGVIVDANNGYILTN